MAQAQRTAGRAVISQTLAPSPFVSHNIKGHTIAGL